MMHENSLQTYFDMKQEVFYLDGEMYRVYNAIRNVPLMTGRELALLVLNEPDMNKVRPRIADLHKLGKIVCFGNRKDQISKRTAQVWCTKEYLEEEKQKDINFMGSRDK